MAQPDYDNYTLDELYRSLELMDRDAWPARAARIESIINDPRNLEKIAEQEAFFGLLGIGVRNTVALFLVVLVIGSMMT